MDRHLTKQLEGGRPAGRLKPTSPTDVVQPVPAPGREILGISNPIQKERKRKKRKKKKEKERKREKKEEKKEKK